MKNIYYGLINAAFMLLFRYKNLEYLIGNKMMFYEWRKSSNNISRTKIVFFEEFKNATTKS